MIGRQVLNFIKLWFLDDDNKTGCRFFVVDAYNKPKVLSFYEQNGFKYLYATEKDEINATQLDGENIHTRLMFLDLLHTTLIWRSPINHIRWVYKMIARSRRDVHFSPLIVIKLLTKTHRETFTFQRENYRETSLIVTENKDGIVIFRFWCCHLPFLMSSSSVSDAIISAFS